MPDNRRHYGAEEYLQEAPEAAGPDAGLAAISAGFAAGAVAAVGPGTGMPPRAPRPHHAGPEDVWLLDLSPETIAAAGTLDPTGGDWAVPTGWAWRITEVTILFGSGTSLVTLWKQSAQSAAPLLQVSGPALWEPSDCWLNTGQRLVAVSSGGGMTIWPWGGHRVALHFLPTYLA